ncbi:hypothetical protein L218DRAFT_1007362 [Marasmius fiardii PR-910]|nr:hypothetical protein L218DRAFT_1007362 [Marasmius fiardii PR-910]
MSKSIPSLQHAINSSTLYGNNQQNGVLQVTGMSPGSPTDPYLVRGLATAYRRNQINPEMREYIKGFINIQYNHLLDNATLIESGVYVDRSSGPPNRLPQKSLNKINQTDCSMAYIHAIGSVNATSGSSNPLHPNDHPRFTTKTAKTGGIVGGVLGGVIFFVLVSGLTVYLRRRQRHKVPSTFLTSPYNLSESAGVEGSLIKSPTSPRKGIQSRSDARNSSIPPMSQASPQLQIKTRLDPPSQESTVATSAEEESNLSPYIDSASPHENPHARYHAISTAELAGILNARLQAEAFHDDMPPSYPQSRVGI